MNDSVGADGGFEGDGEVGGNCWAGGEESICEQPEDGENGKKTRLRF